ncbi:MAG: hypothetical protein IPP49_18960 [Saprospiraceae bacterium]|nr:hypothetical protein [Saprospiraceae bacterium]
MNRELAILEKLEKELSLKQLQIKSLLTITQAINDNVSADGLFNMYKSFLSWEMGIEKMALFIIDDDGWIVPLLSIIKVKADQILFRYYYIIRGCTLSKLGKIRGWTDLISLSRYSTKSCLSLTPS